MQRKPSHFGSNSQPSPSGIVRVSLASIGLNGGCSGRATTGILGGPGTAARRAASRRARPDRGGPQVKEPTSSRWKIALAAATGAGVAAVAVIALSGGPASRYGGAGDTTPTTEPGDARRHRQLRDGRTITVTGHGTVQVVPDIATLSAGVQANADTATEAMDTCRTSRRRSSTR